MNTRRWVSAFVLTVLALCLSVSIASPSSGLALPRANQHALDAAISADGRFVAFASRATDLVPGDTNEVSDIFIYERTSGLTSLIEQEPDGPVARDAAEPSLSADGRFVAYSTGRVYVLDRQTGETTLVSRSSDGEPDWGKSPVISGDGRYIAFQSGSPTLVDDDTQVCSNGSGSCDDVFLYDRETGETKMISRNALGRGGDDDSWRPTISGDGRVVAFYSNARNLLEGNPDGPIATNGHWNVYAYDRLTGRLSLVSVNSAGQEVKGGGTQPSISSNGQLVAFVGATNLPGANSDPTQVYVHDRQSGETTLVSVNDAGEPGNDSSYAPSLSADGRHVTFESEATNLASGGGLNSDIFVRDLEAGRTILVSQPRLGGASNSYSWGPAISGDGRLIVYTTMATNLGAPFVYDEKDDIALHDRATRRTTILTARPPVRQGNSDSREASISADGRFIAFASFASNLGPGSRGGLWDIYVRDMQTGQMTAAPQGSESFTHARNPVISADGQWVAFEGDTPPYSDAYKPKSVYLYDRTSGKTTRISRPVPGQPLDPSAYEISGHPALSADGRLVAFDSGADNLVPNDTNDSWDIFVYDRLSDTVTILPQKIGDDGKPVWLAAFGPVLSPDGRYLAFLGYIWPYDRFGGEPDGAYQIFVHDRQTGDTTAVPFGPLGPLDTYYKTDGPSISADGRSVAFATEVWDVVPDDDNMTYDVFVYDRQTGVHTLISRNSQGQQGNKASRQPVISADGRFVTYWSDSSNLIDGDDNGAPDVFQYDRQTVRTVLVSHGPDGGFMPGQSYGPSSSPDGKYVAFWSGALLVPGDVNGYYDVFRFEREGTTQLVSGTIRPGPFRSYAPLVNSPK